MLRSAADDTEVTSSLARDEVRDLAAAYRLDAARTRALFALAGFDAPPTPSAVRRILEEGVGTIDACVEDHHGPATAVVAL